MKYLCYNDVDCPNCKGTGKKDPEVALDGGNIVGSGVIHHGDPGECHHKLIIGLVQAERYIC